MIRAEIKIGDRMIGRGQPPFIVAEFSGNHNRSLERALRMVDEAAEAGAHAVKLQTYTPDTLTIQSEDKGFRIDSGAPQWQGNSLYELYSKACTPWEWHEPIFKRCRERGIEAFSTVFDETSVDFLEGLGVPAYKIASFENNHTRLIRKAASTGKPLLISTGLAAVSEMDDAVKAAGEGGCRELLLLKCTSAYPAPPIDANLATIPHMKALFGVEVGLSDHTLGIGISIASIALGASLIERHFTLSRSEGGVDSFFSLEPAELKSLCCEAFKVWQSIGDIRYGLTESERPSVRFRRSIYAVRDIREGEVLTAENIRIIRPGDGLKPKHYEVLLGKKASRAIKRGVPVSWEHIR